MTMAQIKAHPWFKAPVPSFEDVYEEFAQRQEILDSLAENGDEVPDEIDSNVFNENVHRGEGDSDGDSSEEEDSVEASEGAILREAH